jgi:hypothetical protein
VLELEDAPIQQLSRSLMKSLFRIANVVPKFEANALQIFVEHLKKVGSNFADSIDHKGRAPFSL